MARTFSFSTDGFYHIYSRGTEKRTIFADSNDYKRFMALLYVANSANPVSLGKGFNTSGSFTDFLKQDRGETLANIGAYCLMPNHFHLLLHEKKEGGISTFMQKLGTAYTMYFNTKRERTGSLFEGRFRGRVVTDEKYLNYLFAYIHLNPIKLIDPTWKEKGIADIEEARDYIQTFPYSSYLDFVGKDRHEKAILGLEPFAQYVPNHTDFSDFIEDWLSYDESDGEAWKAIKPEEVKAE